MRGSGPEYSVSIELYSELKKEGFKLPHYMFDFLKVLIPGAKKHGVNNWLDPENEALKHTPNHASVNRHVAEWYMGVTEDKDTGLDPRLHAATRLLMSYTKDQIAKEDVD